MSQVATLKEIAEFRFHFDQMYVGGIPRLLKEDGAFLSFLAVLTGTEALAGVFAPHLSSGDRFRGFVTRFFPGPLQLRSEDLWKFRNLMVHAFNPGPFGLVCHQSRLHLTPQGDVTVLNAEDFYAALIQGSRAYFDELQIDANLQKSFSRRVAESDGGAPQIFTVDRRTEQGGGNVV
jgi:hypothetical protein